MDSTTYIKNLRISPKKLRFLLSQVKRLTPAQATDYLLYAPKKPARIFLKVIKSAISNAKNTLKTDEKTLRFKLLTVEEGQKLKRYKPGGRGTMKPIMRRFSHIKVILKIENQKVESKQLPAEVKEKQLDKKLKKPLSKENSKVKIKK